MKVHVVRTVTLDTDVDMTIDMIADAIKHAAESGGSSKEDACNLLLACWQTLSAFTDENIQAVGVANWPQVARSLRELARKFDEKARNHRCSCPNGGSHVATE